MTGGPRSIRGTRWLWQLSVVKVGDVIEQQGAVDEKVEVVIASLIGLEISSGPVEAIAIWSLGRQDRRRRRKSRRKDVKWDAEGQQRVAVEDQELDRLSTSPL